MKSVSLRWGACEQAGVIGPTMGRNATTRGFPGRQVKSQSHGPKPCFTFSAQLPVKVSTGRRDEASRVEAAGKAIGKAPEGRAEKKRRPEATSIARSTRRFHL
jgi:hypothetical protein